MKKQLFYLLALSICLLSVSPLESHSITGRLHSLKHQFKKGNVTYTDYYQGDAYDYHTGVEYGVYGTAPCCSFGTTINEAYDYATSTYYIASGTIENNGGKYWVSMSVNGGEAFGAQLTE